MFHWSYFYENILFMVIFLKFKIPTAYIFNHIWLQNYRIYLIYMFHLAYLVVVWDTLLTCMLDMFFFCVENVPRVTITTGRIFVFHFVAHAPSLTSHVFYLYKQIYARASLICDLFLKSQRRHHRTQFYMFALYVQNAGIENKYNFFICV